MAGSGATPVTAAPCILLGIYPVATTTGSNVIVTEGARTVMLIQAGLTTKGVTFGPSGVRLSSLTIQNASAVNVLVVWMPA